MIKVTVLKYNPDSYSRQLSPFNAAFAINDISVLIEDYNVRYDALPTTKVITKGGMEHTVRESLGEIMELIENVRKQDATRVNVNVEPSGKGVNVIVDPDHLASLATPPTDTGSGGNVG